MFASKFLETNKNTKVLVNTIKQLRWPNCVCAENRRTECW